MHPAQQPGAAPLRGVALIDAIHTDHLRLSPKMQLLARYCLHHAHALHRVRILELAAQTNNVPSTVVRFAKRYGYVGFHDFKLAFLQEQEAIAWAQPG
jgi:DNA-binding MurR/RpiR family transcriptional regulator